MTVVKNISISDAVTGHIIYQRVYAWTTSSAFSNLGKLIEGFCKFSREVDDGVIHGIDFETKPKYSIRRKRDDVLQSNRCETMHLLTAQTNNITVSIFFDMNRMLIASLDDKKRFQILLEAIKIAFETKYLLILNELRNAKLIHYNSDVDELLEITEFDEFHHTADKLCEHIIMSYENNTSSNHIDRYINSNLELHDQVILCLKYLNVSVPNHHHSMSRPASPLPSEPTKTNKQTKETS